jgi:hypothetical protein
MLILSRLTLLLLPAFVPIHLWSAYLFFSWPLLLHSSTFMFITRLLTCFSSLLITWPYQLNRSSVIQFEAVKNLVSLKTVTTESLRQSRVFCEYHYTYTQDLYNYIPLKPYPRKDSNEIPKDPEIPTFYQSCLVVKIICRRERWWV